MHLPEGPGNLLPRMVAYQSSNPCSSASPEVTGGHSLVTVQTLIEHHVVWLHIAVEPASMQTDLINV